MLLTTAATMAMMLLGAPGQPAAAYGDKIITNYWQHIQELYAVEAARPRHRELDPNNPYPEPRTYPFGSFHHLRPADIIQGVHESIRYMRKKYEGQPPEIVDRHVMEGIQLCLEYYPLLTNSDEDLNQLIYLMVSDQADIVLREYLIERCVPGARMPSLLSAYMQRILSYDRSLLRDGLLRVAGHPFEPDRVMYPLMNTLYTMSYLDYKDAFDNDPVVMEYNRKNKTQLPFDAYVRENNIELTAKTKEKMAQSETDLQGLLRAFGTLAAPNNRHAPQVRETAQAYLNRMKTELPLANAEAVEEVIRNPQIHYDSEAAPMVMPGAQSPMPEDTTPVIPAQIAPPGAAEIRAGQEFDTFLKNIYTLSGNVKPPVGNKQK